MRSRVTNVLALLLLVLASMPIGSALAQPAAQIDATVERLPEGFRGDDPMAVWEALSKLPLAKDEFESGDAHRQRLAEMAKQDLIPGRPLGGAFVFVVDLPQLTYDADRQALSIVRRDEQIRVMPGRGRVNVDWSSTALYRSYDLTMGVRLMAREPVVDTYQGTTVMGLSTTITRIRNAFLTVDMCNRKVTYCERVPGDNDAIPMPPERARDVRDHVSAAIIGRLQAPYRIEETWRSLRPTIDVPKEIFDSFDVIVAQASAVLFFDRRTGEVIYRLPVAPRRL